MALTSIKTLALLLTLSLSILACQSNEDPFVNGGAIMYLEGGSTA